MSRIAELHFLLPRANEELSAPAPSASLDGRISQLALHVENGILEIFLLMCGTSVPARNYEHARCEKALAAAAAAAAALLLLRLVCCCCALLLPERDFRRFWLICAKPRKRNIFFARQREKTFLALLAQKPGFCGAKPRMTKPRFLRSPRGD